MKRTNSFQMAVYLAAVLFVVSGLAVLTLAATVQASGLKADEEVLFFSTAAHLDVESDMWVATVHGWVFEPEEDSVMRSALVEDFLKWLELPPGSASKEIFRKRARMFLVDSERGKELNLNAPGRTFVTEPSGPNGHFNQSFTVNRKRAAAYGQAGWLPFETNPRTSGDRTYTGKVQLIPPAGVSVISDIDDTIKISGVLDKEVLLVNTFLKEYQPVPGMPEAYRKGAAEGAVFHYVSASPWQLYPFISEFMSREGFPAGSFSLKTFRIKDRTFFNLFSSPEKGKIPAIESIVSRYPGRQFILVGDSGEKDPEIFGEIARRHQDQVVRIWIRNVRGSDVSKTRLLEAFKGVEKDIWKVFNDPGELNGSISGRHP